MDIEKISIGNNPPQDINVIIEVPANESPVKYEYDKENNSIWVDRFLSTPMVYPANYGFIPHTLCGDGDPTDVLALTPFPLKSGSALRCRPVGVLKMEDESGMDEKIIAVPIHKLTPLYDNINNYTDLPAIICQTIEHFFTHYKDLEKGKWVKILGWGDIKEAESIILESIKRAQK